jgi:uncharacterized membrane protein (UPF0182 family)
MYTAIIIVLLALAVYLAYSGIKSNKKGRAAAGIIIGALTIIFFWSLDFWGEMLWFENLGYGDRFWVYIIAETVTALVGAFISLGIISLLTYSIPSSKNYVRRIVQGIGIVAGAAWGYSNWQVMLKFWFRVPMGISEPVLNRDAGFYLFTLPFLDSIYALLIILTIISLGAILFTSFLKFDEKGNISTDFSGFDKYISAKPYTNILVTGAFLIFVLAYDKYLSRFHLMFSDLGVVRGPGWTDVNVLLPAYDIIIVIMILSGAALLIKPARGVLQKFYYKLKIRNSASEPVLLFSVLITIFVIWFIGLTAIPGLFQWLRVEPNEITFEKPYIENNIRLTRYGFNLQKIEEKEYPAKDVFNKQIVEDNKATFENIRLWDWRALDDVYKQFQEIRLYYEFKDVDIDRYTFNNEYRQVMVSAREMESSNLPAQSQTFVNTRFKYTHGYGITLTTVSDFTPEGLPNLLIKDIPPISKYKELEVKQPRIYYGELTDSYVVVNSDEPEFDYPSGEQNVNIKYPGSGGIQISNIWRKFLFGWKFDGTKFFFSSYPNAQSRVMFHRQIMDRVRTLAPFLEFDKDPYIVLGDDGKLYWIIDAFTTSSYFPYSETFNSTEHIGYKEGDQTRTLSTDTAPELDGINYIRNSVKVVIDAFNGTTDFYIFDENDPLIRVWDNIFPGLFKKKSEMPAGLVNHVRYPIDLMMVQGLMYAKYHMTDPTVFYNQEDLWIRATEKYYNAVQPVNPYYIMWQLPGSKKAEFVLILPFTPKNRQVSIGWVAGMCDGDNYGRFIAYKFPKDKSVLGPQQVETKIDQDSYLSGQLSLWDQRGSNVIRGNVLAIPVAQTLIYVEPIYLQAETAAYPELRLVAVMHGDNLTYAETFEEALQELYGESPVKQSAVQEEVPPVVKEMSVDEKINEANDAFNNYLKYQGQGEFQKAAGELERLQTILKELTSHSDKGQEKK